MPDLTPPSIEAPASNSALQLALLLQGRWTNDKVQIDIDAKGGVARNNAGSWQDFRVINVTGEMVVFSIGQRIFYGLLRKDALTLTRPNEPTQIQLSRSILRSTISE